MKTALRLLLPALTIASLAGCAAVHVTSDPPGASIFYSETGVAPWKPWPPGGEMPGETPAWKTVWPEPYIYVRVEEDGYYPVRPVFLDVRMFRRQKVHFILDQTFEQQQRAKGLVLFEKEWMTPEERFRREQAKKGLYLHEPTGEWVTEKELENRVAQAKRDAGYVRYQSTWVKPREEGLVEYKGRWMRPQEAASQRLVDRHVADILDSHDTIPLTITRTGATPWEYSQLWIADLAGETLEVFLSGPVSQEEIVLPYHSVTFESEPGTYTLVVRVAGEKPAPAAVTTVNLESKRIYAWSYRGPNVRADEVLPEMPGLDRSDNPGRRPDVIEP